jgi:peptidyl-prolyl cis-trans isomerase A (cyclophilin A)
MRHDARLISDTIFQALALCACLAARPAFADTIVTFTTNLGTFDVQLYDTQVPTTVANFLSYVNAGSYTNSIFHRSTTNNPAGIQIVQGGGFELVMTTATTASIDPIATAAPIPLQAGLSNLKGTIAMARTAAPNSATSQWFFNVTDNLDLDPSPGNDGYAVFGAVIGGGISVIEAIGAVPVYDASSVLLNPAFSELPLLNPALEPQNLVMVNSIVAVPEPGTLALALTCVLMYTSRALRNRRLAIGQSDDGSLSKRTQIRLLGSTA